MDKALKNTFIIITIIIFFSTLVTADINPSFSKTLTPKEALGFHRNHDTLTHLHFYFHDSVKGKNPSAARVAWAPTTNASPTGFGSVSVMDDPLTIQPHRSSKQVGSGQGVYASASQAEFGLLMALNFVFTEGKYNGSALSVLGHNALASAVREMPVVGGSGVFRLARGYVLARTYSFNITSLDAVVEYDVYVFH